MGRCVACNKNLNDFEATRKSAVTGHYLDLCNHCYGYVKDDIETVDREDLSSTTEITDDDEIYDCGDVPLDI